MDIGETSVVSVSVRAIASDKNWIEGNAVQQLETAAQLKGMRRAVGMPDLHAGKGCPIGAALLRPVWSWSWKSSRCFY